MRIGKHITALVLLGFAANANAIAPENLRPALDDLVARETLLAPTGYVEPPTEARKQQLIEMLKADPRVAAAPELTLNLVMRVVYDNVVQYRTTIDEARSLVTHYTENVGSMPAPKMVSHLVQLLLPYAMDAGVCEGDPLGDEGASCTFAFAPPGAPEHRITGTIGEGPDAVPVREINPDSPLYAVLSGCADDEDCRELAAPLLATETAVRETNKSVAAEMLAALRGFDYGRLLGLIGIGNAHAYIQTYERQRNGEAAFAYNGIQLRLAYGYAYHIKLRCGKAAGWGCDLWGEVVSAGNLKYLVSGSDMMMVVLPFSFHCPASCMYSGLTSYASSWINDKWLGGEPTFDAEAFALSARDNATLRGAGSYARHTARGSCGVVPMPVAGRPTHEAYKAWAGKVPYAEHFDLSPHTSFQVPATSPLTPLLSYNMDPQPTRATGKLPSVSCNPLPITVDFVWTYDFLLVAAWNFNVMFSALDNLNVVNSCGPDQFWVWHGAQGSGGKGLKALTWTFAFAGGHLHYTRIK